MDNKNKILFIILFMICVISPYSSIVYGAGTPPPTDVVEYTPPNPVASLPRAWADRFLNAPRFFRVNETTIYLFMEGGDAPETGEKLARMHSNDNGVTWEWSANCDPIADFANTTQEWCEWGTMSCPVPILHNGTKYLIWSSRPTTSSPFAKWQSGIATSPDDWTTFDPIDEINPIIPVGANNTWDDERAYHPFCLLVDSTYYCYYSGYNGSDWYIGLTTTSYEDFPYNWTKYGENPFFEGRAPEIVEYDGVYYCYYTDTGDPEYGISLRNSTDLYNWSEPIEVSGGVAPYWNQQIAVFDAGYGYIIFGNDYRWSGFPIIEMGIFWELGYSWCINASLSTDDDWLYQGEVYELTAYWNYTNYAYINFTDTEHNIYFRYYNETKIMDVYVEDFTGTKTNELVIGLIESNYEITGNITKTTWKFVLDTNIVDCDNTNFYWYAENYYGNYRSGITSLVKKIYNLGGKTEYNIGGTGFHVIGGDAFELGVKNNNDYAQANTTFRKLQHLHGRVEWYFNNSEYGDYLIVEDDTEVMYGFDYRLNQEWHTGWYCVLKVVDGKVGDYGAGTDGSWIKIKIDWYNGKDELVKTDYIYSYHYGYDVPTTEFTQRKSTELWFDLWFNKMNASTVIGGRVNAVYNGMREKGWWIWSTWSPMVGNITSSMFFDDLMDENGTVLCSKNLELIRAWCRIQRIESDTDGITEYLSNYQILNWETAQDRMMGVDTPIFVEPKNIEVANTGFLAPLYKAISAIGATIWKGALGFSKVFIGAIDSFLMFLGLPEGTFTTLVQFVSQGFSQILGMLHYVIDQLSNMLSAITSILTFVLMFIDAIVNGIIWIVGTPLTIIYNIFRIFMALINGEDITVYGFPYEFSDYHDFIIGMRTVLPLTVAIAFAWWFITGKSNPFNEGGDDGRGIPSRTLKVFSFISNFFKAIFWVFNWIRNEAISVYNFIRSHIPTLGGGGGSTEEGNTAG